MSGVPVRCNWAPTLGPITEDGDSDASFEAGRSTSGYNFMSDQVRGRYHSNVWEVSQWSENEETQ
eukprot:4954978-Pleurochrysis_carterae.AAC.1